MITVWAGPCLGIILPLALWRRGFQYEFLARFFAGFCLVTNGAYLGVGAVEPVGDARVILSHGTPGWCLWLFGIVSIPTGLILWNGAGPEFGLGRAAGKVDSKATWVSLALLVGTLLLTSLLSARA